MVFSVWQLHLNGTMFSQFWEKTKVTREDKDQSSEHYCFSGLNHLYFPLTGQRYLFHSSYVLVGWDGFGEGTSDKYMLLELLEEIFTRWNKSHPPSPPHHPNVGVDPCLHISVVKYWERKPNMCMFLTFKRKVHLTWDRRLCVRGIFL